MQAVVSNTCGNPSTPTNTGRWQLWSLDFPIERYASAAKFCVPLCDWCLHIPDIAACHNTELNSNKVIPPKHENLAEHVSRSSLCLTLPRTPKIAREPTGVKAGDPVTGTCWLSNMSIPHGSLHRQLSLVKAHVGTHDLGMFPYSLSGLGHSHVTPRWQQHSVTTNTHTDART